jgi:hypothetical protein
MKKKLNITELLTLSELLGQCTNDRNLKKSSTIISGIKVSKSINLAVKKYFDEQKEIFIKFDVKEKEVDGNQVYNWDEKSKKEIEQINNTLEELRLIPHNVEYLNRIDEDDFVIYTRGLNHSQVSFLYDYLVK